MTWRGSASRCPACRGGVTSEQSAAFLTQYACELCGHRWQKGTGPAVKRYAPGVYGVTGFPNAKPVVVTPLSDYVDALLYSIGAEGVFSARGLLKPRPRET